jgi:hypothetical protein
MCSLQRLPVTDDVSLYYQVVYQQYASLFFVCEVGEDDNELITLEIIHRYVEVLDRYFGNVRSVAYCFISHSQGIHGDRSVSWICEHA